MGIEINFPINPEQQQSKFDYMENPKILNLIEIDFLCHFKQIQLSFGESSRNCQQCIFQFTSNQ